MIDPRPCPTCGKPVAHTAPRGLCPECLLQAGLSAATQTDSPDAPPLAAPPSVEEIAPLFPQLEVLELLGRGGMGAVYKARQPQLERFVALKLLLRRRQDGSQDSAFAERFAREARALAKLNHPNIVSVYDYGEAGSYAFLLMEYVPGMTLRQLLQRGKLTPDEALAIVPRICEALQFAHQQGVVHRDIKPENILLDEQGRVKIGDFGIAKIADPASGVGLTQDRQVIGTPHYMAPEQVERPQTVDHRADIYSLGVVFYEMLTGELPLGKFLPPSQKSWADVRLDPVVLQALEKEPERRYQQASEVKTAIEQLEAAPVPAPPVIKPAATAWKPVLLAAAALFFLLICAVTIVLGLKLRTGIAHHRRPVVAAPLNAEQCRVLEWTDRQFRDLVAVPTFAGASEKERAEQERQFLEALRGEHTDDYYKAINGLAALHRPGAVQALLSIATDPRERDNRERWMAVRALGKLGDDTVVPGLIHLTYHYNTNVRWWAQIALVQLTGTNFGNDWKAWGQWWNQSGGQPPFKAEQVRWSSDPQASDPATLAEHDRRWLSNIGGRPQTKQAPAKAPPKAEAPVSAGPTNPPAETEVPFAEPGQPVAALTTPQRNAPASIEGGEQPLSGNPSARIDPTVAASAFDQVWSAFDRDYAMFGLRPEVDWAKLRDQYRPMALQANSAQELARVFAHLLKPLRDLHVWVKVAGKNVPVFQRPAISNANPSARRAILGDINDAGPAVQWAVTADKVGYLAISRWMESDTPSRCDEALEQMRDTRGLIVDVRLNGGGSENLGAKVAGRFLKEPFVYGYNQIRNGPRHTDLGRKSSRTVSPRGPWRYEHPVVLLIGQRCMSSNESFVAMMSGVPGIVIMGDHTRGSSGNPQELHLPMDITVSVPRWIDYLPDGTLLDERGFQPQVPFKPAPDAFRGKRDDLLSAALERLRPRA
jgi:serine/threonine protein kinase